MAKQKQLDTIVAEGLATLFGHQKFNIAQASAITEAFGAIVGVVRMAEDLEKRVKKLETAAKKSKSAPLVQLREAS